MWQAFYDAWWRLATQSHPQSLWDVLACRALKTGSVVYQAAVGLRNVAYDRGWAPQVRLPCRVVSVGNLTVGGTGKTACVELIARKLTRLGRRVAILSRGYGGTRRGYWLRSSGGRLELSGEAQAASDGLADEPQLLAAHLEGVPVLVGARRDRTGRSACRDFGADTVILDDGFQHRQLRRDCDIVLVHARTPVGGWAVLPRGPMREPITSLARAHVVIVAKADEAFEMLGALGERLRSLNPAATLVTAVHEPTSLVDGVTGERHDPDRLAGLRLGLVSSIGDPAGFEATVRRLHASVLWHQAFPDHHVFRAADWAMIRDRASADRPEAVLTTEKDWVRLRPVTARPGASEGRARVDWALPMPVLILGVVLRVLSGEEALDARLAGLCAR